ncbi:hypothetical protein LTR62_000907 [Meristemomyces frigidus]|uniref:ubiquitinyl hydrolase 1 n=1 Tax=Meristemomyces frigidus TaxID=1508187 RepID=A0AAN7TK60_9PEZI|nr:hypothetical protein LTR62_000907 [Meristemomyces frigidus]
MTQHSEFRRLICKLFNELQQMLVLYLDAEIKLPILRTTEDSLIKRDDIRSSTFRLSGFGAEAHSAKFDLIYQARDQDQQTSQAFQRAFSISSWLLGATATLCEGISLLAELSPHLWSQLAEADPISGPNAEIDLSRLRYDAQLLQSDLYKVPLRHFLSLHQNLARQSTSTSTFDLIMWFASLSMGGTDLTVLQTLGLAQSTDIFSHIAAPPVESFVTKEGKLAKQSVLEQIAEANLLPKSRTPVASLVKYGHESHATFRLRRDNQYRSYAYIDLGTVMSAVRVKFKTWFDNKRLHDYLEQLGASMTTIPLAPPPVVPWTLRIAASSIAPACGSISSDDLFTGAAPSLPDHQVEALDLLTWSASPQLDCALRLTELVDNLDRSGTDSSFEKDYARDLRASLDSLQGREEHFELRAPPLDLRPALQGYHTQCHCLLISIYEEIVVAVSVAPAQLLGNADLESSLAMEYFPRVSPSWFLSQLRFGRREKLTTAWRACLVQYATIFTIYFRAGRLLKCSHSTEDLIAELRNIPHTNWNTSEHLDALSLEVESNLTIRPVQEEIAMEMRSEHGHNRCMKLHMGQGKSSVIVPMVAAAVADGTKLVRVVVAKAQSKQMAQMLIAKCRCRGNGHINISGMYGIWRRSAGPARAYTRGIDLKLPTNYRAAITLGANLTKDRLTQAAMRMRKLGQGQTLTFCVPGEIKRKIEDALKKANGNGNVPVFDINVSNILQWAISETFADVRRGMPLWAIQGQRFIYHRNLWDQVRTEGVTEMSNLHSRKCAQFTNLNFRTSALQEEQERELSPEIEQERQVQRPAPAEPLTPTLHRDVVSFWETGILKRTSKAFRPAFETLRYIKAAVDFDVTQLIRDGGLLVTADFSKTVIEPFSY